MNRKQWKLFLLVVTLILTAGSWIWSSSSERITETSSGIVSTAEDDEDSYNPFEENGCTVGDPECDLKIAPKFSIWHPLTSLNKKIVYYICRGLMWVVKQVQNLFERSGTQPYVMYGLSLVPNFRNAALRNVVLFFTGLSWFMLAAGIVFSVAETGIACQNGSGNAIQTVKNIIFAFLFCIGSSLVFSMLFDVMTKASLSLAVDAALHGGTESSEVLASWKEIGFDGSFAIVVTAVLPAMMAVPGGWAVVVALLIALLVSIIRFFIQVAKRGVVFLSMLAKGSLMPFSISRGMPDAFRNYVMEYFSFLIGVILQMWTYFFGIALLANQQFLNGFAFMACSNEVFSFVGARSGSESNLLGSIHDALFITESLSHFRSRMPVKPETGSGEVI